VTCRSAGPHAARILPGRHTNGCEHHDACDGCLPCPHPHCRVCRRTHTPAAVCTDCLHAVRTDLTTIRDLAANERLLAQAVHTSGVNSPAFNLAGPTANREAWTHRALAAVLAPLRGLTTDDGYLQDNQDELHPTWVLAGWVQDWRDYLQQPTDLDLTLNRSLDWLLDHLHELAHSTDPSFDQFAGEVAAVRAHLQAVLHDQAQGDTANVGCFDCGGTLERKLVADGFEDAWTCRRCHRRYTYAEYMFAIRATLESSA
jgi:hypothetical protein